MCAKAPWSLWSSTVVWAMPLWHRHRFNISHVLCYHRLLLFVQFRERWEASFYHFSLCFLSHTCGIYKSAPSLGTSSVFPSQIWMPYLLPEKGFRARLWYVGVQFRIVSWWLVAFREMILLSDFENKKTPTKVPRCWCPTFIVILR